MRRDRQTDITELKSPFAIFRTRLKKRAEQIISTQREVKQYNDAQNYVQNRNLQAMCFSLILFGDEIRLVAECLRS
jgi:hypothetical protein